MSAKTANELEQARLLFARECLFVRGITTPDDVPDTKIPEVAVVGRSNVGKSSLLNALTNRKTLARVSNTPGRTRQINFFSLDNRLMLTDLPGYGFARVSKTESLAWNHLIFSYLSARAPLRRTMLLIDGRRGLMASDIEVMTLLDRAAVSYQLVLTKADKVGDNEIRQHREAIDTEAKKHVAAHPVILETSAETGHGIPELRAALAELAVNAR